MFSLICAGGLRRHRVHNDVIVMMLNGCNVRDMLRSYMEPTTEVVACWTPIKSITLTLP